MPQLRLLPALCHLGLHRPGVARVWNNDIAFTRCGRCGKDLIRQEGERWRVPRGCRVVWKTLERAEADADAGWSAVARPRRGKPGADGRPKSDLPIQDVLDGLPERTPREAPAPWRAREARLRAVREEVARVMAGDLLGPNAPPTPSQHVPQPTPPASPEAAPPATAQVGMAPQRNG